MTYEYSYLIKTEINEFKHVTDKASTMNYMTKGSVLSILNTLASEGWRVIKIEESRWWLEREVRDIGCIVPYNTFQPRQPYTLNNCTNQNV